MVERNFLGTATWMVAFPYGLPFVRWVLFLLSLVALAAFVRRVGFHIRNARLERRHLSFNPLATARSPG